MNRAGVWYGSSLSRTLQAFDCGHGYAQEEYAAKREKKRAFFDPSYTLCFKEIRVPPKNKSSFFYNFVPNSGLLQINDLIALPST